MLRFSSLIREIIWVPDAWPKHELNPWERRKAVVGKRRLEEDGIS